MHHSSQFSQFLVDGVGKSGYKNKLIWHTGLLRGRKGMVFLSTNFRSTI